MHQGNVRRGSTSGVIHPGGTQCTIMALTALVLCTSLAPLEWVSDTVDLTVQEADNLYCYVVDTFFGGNHNMYIGHDMIPGSVNVFGGQYQVSILHTWFGITSLPGNAHHGTVAFGDGLHSAFALSGLVLATVGAESFALIQDVTGIHLFDSHSRDGNGDANSDGAAVMLHFADHDEAAYYMLQHFGDAQFEFSPVHIMPHNSESSGFLISTNSDIVSSSDHDMNTDNTNMHDYDFMSQYDIIVDFGNDTGSNDIVMDCEVADVPTSADSVTEEVEMIYTEIPANSEFDLEQVIHASSLGTSMVKAEIPSSTQFSALHDSDKNQDCAADLSSVIKASCLLLADPDYCCAANDSNGWCPGNNAEIDDLTGNMSDCGYIMKFCADKSIGCDDDIIMKDPCDNSDRSAIPSIICGNDDEPITDNCISNGQLTTAICPISDNYCNSQAKNMSGKNESLLMLSGKIRDSMCDQIALCQEHDRGIPNLSSNDKEDCQLPEQHYRNLCDQYGTINYDPMTIKAHSLGYEKAIRFIAVGHCVSCHRLLFPEQVQYISNNFDLPAWLQCKGSSRPMFCCTCITAVRQHRMPTISVHANKLHVRAPPAVLTDLNKLEKRLLSRIQVFMTMVILPGGQYAEKGLVLNMPIDVQCVMGQAKAMRDLPFCVISFEGGSSKCLSQSHYIRPAYVNDAFGWLCNNNKYYTTDCLTAWDVDFNKESSDTVADDERNVEALEECSLVPVDYSMGNREISSNAGNVINVPRSSCEPVNIYDIEGGEEMAFPRLFPHGINGYNAERVQRVPYGMYFRSRLYNFQGHWRRDISYLLHGAASFDKHLLRNEIGIYLKMTSNEKEGFKNNDVTASYVCNSQRDINFLQNSYMFMKNIRGTIAYFRNALNDLLAMVRTLGPSTLFMTLSADDLHWPELGMLLENIDYGTAVKKQSLLESMRSDPLMSATHFERRFNALMKHVIKGPEKPLGEVVDYFYRVEFQNRGSCHYHIFFWIKDIPSDINSETADALLTYIDKVIKTELPNQADDPELHNMVRRLQMHSHGKYCTPHGKSSCRFNFPYKPCKKSRILTHGDSIKRKGKYYETRRDDKSGYVNAYNPTILRHFRANMDIQMVNNAESVAYYVCAYICKSEPDELNNAIGNLITSVFPQQKTMSAYQKLWKIGLTVLRHRRLSAQEAAFRLSNLKMVHSSRAVVYLNTRHVSERFKMLKPIAELEQLEPDSTDVYRSNLIDYYRARPDENSQMCLYFFAAWYEKIRKSGRKSKRATDIYIKEYDLWFRKRGKFRVVRYPKFAMHSEEYFFSLLMMLLPHHNEAELLAPYETAADAFYHKEDLMDKSLRFTHFSFAADIDTAITRITHYREELKAVAFAESQARNSLHSDDDDDDDNNVNLMDESNLSDVTAGSGQQHNSTPYTFSDENCNEDHGQSLHSNDDLYVVHGIKCRMSTGDIDRAVHGFTDCQKKVYDVINTFYTLLDSGSQNLKSLYIFISGAGGVGKSFLVNVIISRLEHSPIIPGHMPVKVCAPTGTAARNVKGRTIHSLLKIPVSKYNNYVPLHPHALQLLRVEFHGVHTLVIDEISMVSSMMVTMISRRLAEIYDNNSPFGGINIIVVGDIFQLRPVLGKAIYTNTLLWQKFQPYFLVQNVRQSTDESYGRLLNRARIGILLPCDIAALKSRLIDIAHNDQPDVLHIYPLRSQVKVYNKLRQSQLLGAVAMITIAAEHFYSAHDAECGQEVSDYYIPEDERHAGNLVNSLHICVGTRVMLIRNIMTSDGLVNGAMGIVTSVNYEGKYITSISVLFDDESVGRLTNVKGHQPISIERIDHEYMYHGRTMIRRQFPLMQSWACTIHKVQGMTFDKIVVDVGSSVFEPGMAYVALSRVKTLSGLFITAFDVQAIKCDINAVLENERLKKLIEGTQL